jgi:hypothetical protein
MQGTIAPLEGGLHHRMERPIPDAAAKLLGAYPGAIVEDAHLGGHLDRPVRNAGGDQRPSERLRRAVPADGGV